MNAVRNEIPPIIAAQSVLIPENLVVLTVVIHTFMISSSPSVFRQRDIALPVSPAMHRGLRLGTKFVIAFGSGHCYQPYPHSQLQ